MRSYLVVCVAAWMWMALVGSTAEAAAPRDVKDYFLALPEKYLGLGDTKSSAQERTEALQLVDLKNGYLRAEFPASEGYVELAVFKRADRSDLVAVSAVACAPVCEQELTFLDPRDGKWRDVTKDVFTPVPQADLQATYRELSGKEPEVPLPVLYDLPRYGTSLLLRTQEEFVDAHRLYALHWDRTRFKPVSLSTSRRSRTSEKTLGAHPHLE
jgi:hypothetical protein